MKSQTQRGFTLLELLVAMALISVVVIGLMAVFRNTLTMYAEIRDSRESAMQMRILSGILGDDLLTLARDYSFIGSTGETGERIEPLLEFISGVSAERQDAEPSLTRVFVVYSLARIGEEEEFTLLRSERRNPFILGDWDESSEFFELRDSSMPILRNIERLKFYYEWRADVEQDFCSVPAGGDLPLFVRMEVVLRHGEKRVFHSVRFPVSRRF